MSVLDHKDPDLRDEDFSEEARDMQDQKGAHGGHSRWMMIACCVPMLAIAVVVALSGAGFGFLVVAVMCTAMMALMMGGMSSGDGGGGR